MLKRTHHSLGYPIEYKLVIQTNRPRKVGIVVKDADNANTLYTERWNTIKGKQEFFVKMPQSPKLTEFNIFNVSKDKNSEGVRIAELTPQPLSWSAKAIGGETKDTLDFVEFAQEFSQKASSLSAGIYLSNNGKYIINYMDVIKNNATNEEITTPARINIISGQIQVSKKIFLKYTIPGRMAILLHEYSHVYMNKKSSDESEADLNSARIYLGLGYPRVELLNIWANVFYRADTPGNRERWAYIKNYILKFES